MNNQLFDSARKSLTEIVQACSHVPPDCSVMHLEVLASFATAYVPKDYITPLMDKGISFGHKPISKKRAKDHIDMVEYIHYTT